MKIRNIALAVAIGAASMATANAQTLVNGSFASWTAGLPDGWTTLLTPAQETANSAAPSDAASWTPFFNGGTTKLNTAGAINYGVPWNGSVVDGFQQTVSNLISGHTYAISFATDGINISNGLYTDQLMGWDVSFGGVTKPGPRVHTVNQPGQYQNTTYQPWVVSTLNFVANASSQVLSFAAEVPGPRGFPPSTIVALSGVTITDVTPVPEPASLALMLAGVGCVTFIGRRRARRSA